jgi:hypothetical protein
MFIELDFHSIFGPAVVVALIFIIGFKFWEGDKKDELEKAFSLLKINILAFGFLLVVLWLMLPITPSLSTFGFPDTVSDIDSNEQLLLYLQEYNQAVVRTTQVLYWFIFIFVWGLQATLYSFLKTFKSIKMKEKEEISA